ncbi:MAG: hypothetical protein HUU46_22170 [Candidatus Hydrogenedentes bacterium]|nr:hypothetical protein [Candidatus Hydrogenedentota bacterium]
MQRTQRLELKLRRSGHITHYDLVLDFPLYKIAKEVSLLARCECIEDVLEVINAWIEELDQLARYILSTRNPVVIDKRIPKCRKGDD